MQLPISPNLTSLTRQEALRIWLSRNGLTFSELGRRLGVTPNSVSKLCDQETMPVRRHAQLLEQGLPAELLPRPEDIKPGPRPRDVHEQFLQAFRG
jgi:transcriptional regulator with XRE-family HTH domain